MTGQEETPKAHPGSANYQWALPNYLYQTGSGMVQV